ncbi:hypothetical protein COP2_009239 [Malus domestica]
MPSCQGVRGWREAMVKVYPVVDGGERVQDVVTETDLEHLDNDELARALALSLGNSSDVSKAKSVEKSVDVLAKEGCVKAPLVDDVLAASRLGK